MATRRPASLFGHLSLADLGELLRDRPTVTTHRELPRHLLERCHLCAEWMPAKSKYFGQCGACGVFLPRAAKLTTEPIAALLTIAQGIPCAA